MGVDEAAFFVNRFRWVLGFLLEAEEVVELAGLLHQVDVAFKRFKLLDWLVTTVERILCEHFFVSVFLPSSRCGLFVFSEDSYLNFVE